MCAGGVWSGCSYRWRETLEALEHERSYWKRVGIINKEVNGTVGDGILRDDTAEAECFSRFLTTAAKRVAV